MLRKNLLSMFLAFIFSTAIISVGTASFNPIIAQTNSELAPTIVYVDPPTINGTVINQTFTINISIHAPYDVGYWQAGMTFNATLLECTGVFEGEFLSDEGPTFWQLGSIDNTNGVISAYFCSFLGNFSATGDGRLAYVTFRIKAPGVSDLHLRDVIVWVQMAGASVHIIDVYTVVLDTTAYTVVTVSNSTDTDSGFFDHAFNASAEEISFNVIQPSPIWPIRSGFSNVTIPKTLLSPEPSHGWAVIIDGTPLNTAERTVTENATHTSIYFTYGPGTHEVQITTRFLSSTISIALSSTTAGLGWNVTISGAITPVRENVTVTISYRYIASVGTWTTLATVTTNQDGNYNYTWTLETLGTYEIKASWEGDLGTLDDVSDVQTLSVIPKELVVSLNAPRFVRVDSLSLLNATVYNFGPDNETDVTLQLFINGGIVNSTVIGFLEVNSSYTLRHPWTAPTVEATVNVTAYALPLTNETVTINNVATKFVTVVEVLMFIDPESGPVGTKVTVNGAWFPINQTQVPVTFNDMLIGYAMTDEVGNLTFVFNVPVSVAGNQTVKVFYAEAKYAYRTFTVIDVTPLDIEIDVGAIHFRGELAEFYIQITFEGDAVNTTSISALLYKPDGTTEALTVPSPIETGFYKITYAILGDAPNGTYALVIEASYTTGTIEAHGNSFKTFLLSPTLTTINATLISLNGTVAWVQTEIGLIETDIANIGLEVTAIDGNIATIQTTLGTIEGKITSIEGKIASIEGSVATIETEIGTVKADISTVKGAQEAFTIPQYAAVALALIAAVGTILIIYLRRKPPAKP